MKKLTWSPLGILVSTQLLTAPLSSATYLDADWENGSWHSGYVSTHSDGWLVRQLAENNYGKLQAFTGSNGKSRTNGHYCMRSQLYHPSHYGNSGNLSNPRAELHAKNMDEVRSDFGAMMYYGFSIFLPSNFASDPNTEDILAQWHNVKDPGEGSKQPCVALLVDGDEWILRVAWDADALTASGNFDTLDYPLGNVVLNKWTDFVVRNIWDFDEDGRIKLWMKTSADSSYTLVVADGSYDLRIGGNCFNDQEPGYFKWGIYKPDWRTRDSAVTSRTLYHDNVRVGNSFNAVDPSLQ